MADQLATLADVKLRIFPTGAPADVADDTLLGQLIDGCSDWIQHYTRRKLVPEAGVTYTFDTEAGYTLRIPRGIRAITAMGVASTHQPDTGGTYIAVPAGDRLLRPLAVDRAEGWPATEVRLSRGTLSGTIRTFARADNGATITGDFGFAATPPAIRDVAIDAIAAAYANRKAGASGVVGADGVTVAPWVRYFSSGSPQRATLDRYRVRAI